METTQNIYLEIVEYSTGKVRQRFDMTGKSPKEYESLYRDISRQLDHERFYIREYSKPLKAKKPDRSTLSPTVYSEHCPHCDSENITMVGDPEYNDEWECEDCNKIFSSFKTKIVNGG